ncbi:alpha/beta fold hydrolase [Tissierella sp.]|uniref:esterase/lipase family protein n=1 Tax=Tissierella sp. TaxID=41274 RepID=UPI0028B09466|nr:alpha/beta fold hydrolase [Tissierella sp.]
MDYPIVFIPGLFGSMGDDIIKGTGDFSFGLAERIYRPFIEILNDMGYTEGLDLFICYYNWKIPVLEAVDKYLCYCVEKAQVNTGMKKVILIGHSLGGLLGRAYVNYFNPSFVDKIIMIGTPNLGAVDAYCFWSGGKLPYPKIEDNIIYNGLKLGLILYYYLFERINYIEALREMFPVAKDLLPSYEYGDYLFLKNNGIKEEIPIRSMSIDNSFLNRLEKNFINENDLFIISGRGIYTNKEFIVDLKEKEKIKWADGKPKKIFKTSYGDGTVTTASTLGNLSGRNTILEGNHTSILYKSKNYLATILGKTLTREVKEEKVEKVYVVLADNCNKINIKTLNVDEIAEEYVSIGDNKVQTINLSYNRFLIMVAGDNNLKIKLDIEPIGTKKSKVLVITIDNKGVEFEDNPLKYNLQ